VLNVIKTLENFKNLYRLHAVFSSKHTNIDLSALCVKIEISRVKLFTDFAINPASKTYLQTGFGFV